MGFILILVIIAVIGFFGYRIIRYFAGRTMVSTDELFQQNDVTIDYRSRTLKIGKHSYSVDQVTGISTKWQTGIGGGRFVRIDVDDLVKPVHYVPILGGEMSGKKFMQRVCVALRKAGGPSFI
jgi:hypothetical protein